MLRVPKAAWVAAHMHPLPSGNVGVAIDFANEGVIELNTTCDGSRRSSRDLR
jgi:hypothetical protein